VAALLLGAFASDQPLKPPRYDIPYSTEVVTPHVPWATTLPGGPLRGFFIPTVSQGRDMVELMQRLALQPTTVTIDRQWDVNCWGIGDFYGHEYRGDRDDFRIVYGYAEEELTRATPFEVMVIPGLNGWSRITRPVRDAILRRVREGAGLVLLHPFVGDVKGHPFEGDPAEGDPRIWEVSPLVGVPDDRVSDRGYPEPNLEAITQARWEVARPHFVTEALDLDLLPSGERGGRFYKYEARGEVLVQAGGYPVVAVKAYGKGRVVAFAQVGDGFIPEPVDPVASRTYWDYWEYQYALLARAVLWAARGEGDLRIEASKASAGEGLALTLATPGARTVEIEVAAKSEFGEAWGSKRLQRELRAGTNEVLLPAAELRPPAGWPGGRSILDLIVRDAASGATLHWGWSSFLVPKEASVTGLRPNAPVYREGDVLSVVARAAGALDGLKMRVRVTDDLGRLRQVEEEAARGERAFFHRLDHVLGKRVALTAELVDGAGRIVDQLRHEPLVVVPRERRRRQYKGQLSFETPPHYFAAPRLRLLREQAMDTSYTWGGKVNDELNLPRGWFGVYWYDRGPTTREGMEKAIAEFQRTGDFESLTYLVKKELYRRTGDKRFLVRQPSLDDPQVQARLADLSRTAARNKAVYSMDYYFVGDEGSLGSYTDPVDFCWGPHTLANFRKWLKQAYGSLEALNRSWGSAFSDWEAVVPLTTDEARKEGRFAPWADHRTYMEVSFANAYATVRQAVREGDPDGHIALSGTQVTTPYDGCDWYRLDGVIDDFLSYSGGNQWDLHRSFGKPGARIGFWTGYGRSGLAVQAEVWTAALSGVLFPQLFWSPSIVNPDFTFSRSGRDLGAAFQALRFEGIGALLMEAERAGDGIALHYSMPSVHAAGILGFHPNVSGERVQRDFPADRDGWVALFEDLGLGFDFVAAPQVEEGRLAGRKVFVLPFSLALSAEEVAAVRGFAEAGGIVVADAATGLFDQHVAWRRTGALDDLFGIAAPEARKRGAATRRVGGPVSVTADGTAWGLRAEDLTGFEALERDVRAGDGRALVRVGETDAAIARPVGKGWAVYLNALLDRYPAAREKPDGGSAYRALLRAVLAHVGLRPAVTVADVKGQPLPLLRVARYRFGEYDVVALLSGDLDVKTTVGRDGVTVLEDARLGPVVRQPVEIALPRSGEVTNARTGEGLGRTDRVRTTLTAGDALVLAVGPPRPSLRIDGPREAARGEASAFTLTASAPGRRLVRWHVFAPDGAFLPEYAGHAVTEGPRASFVLPSALSDPPGEYRLQATDVLSGARAEATLRLK
jgi:hypothetical protein